MSLKNLMKEVAEFVAEIVVCEMSMKWEVICIDQD
jgi:hypothetical protein